jgi:hypothetical protein
VPDKTAKMFQTDLAAAGIPYVDDAGRYADFHSLRHTTGTLLAATGAHPKVVQSIMRHCDINLTMSRYAHVLRGQESEAVAGLPDFSLSSGHKQKAVATGTDGRSDLAENLARIGGRRCTAVDGDGHNTLTEGSKTTNLTANGRIRTDNHWFTKPELYR